jgi:glycine/sarcosine N-methyltransferase
MPDRFYDELGSGYDAIIDWESRLHRESPFLHDLFARHCVRAVLDTACGTGEHAALFTSWGLEVTATDISEEMLKVSLRKHAGDPIRWVRAGLGETYEVLRQAFDAVTCLGNSFPHVLTDDLANRTARDFAKLTRPGGVLVIQQLNYEAMRRRHERFMGPESGQVDGRENLFLRVFDLDRNPVRFTMVQMTRADSGWTRRAWETLHRGRTEGEMATLLEGAGFSHIEAFGGFDGSAFDPASSEQMLLVATR